MSASMCTCVSITNSKHMCSEQTHTTHKHIPPPFCSKGWEIVNLKVSLWPAKANPRKVHGWCMGFVGDVCVSCA